jgi:hypothetical protein
MKSPGPAVRRICTWVSKESHAAVIQETRRHSSGSGISLFRLMDERAEGVNARLEVVQADALASGALELVEDARYRVRRLPIAKPTR